MELTGQFVAHDRPTVIGTVGRTILDDGEGVVVTRHETLASGELSHRGERTHSGRQVLSGDVEDPSI